MALGNNRKRRERRRFRRMLIPLAMVAVVVLLGLWQVSFSAAQHLWARLQQPTATDMSSVLGFDVGDAGAILNDKQIAKAVAKVSDKSFPQRDLLVQFLVRGEYKEAVPAFATIVRDRDEALTLRAAALLGIARLDPAQGRSLASNYTGARGDLGRAARRIAQ